MYVVIAKSIYGLKISFKWTKECKYSFEKLKKSLISGPILKVPHYNKTFHVHIDASAYVVRCILAQLGKIHMDFPICYASRQLNVAERNYFTTDARTWE